MEKGRLSWKDVETERVQDMCRQYSQRAAPANSGHQAAGRGASNTACCYAYQQGTCKQEADHKTDKGLILHHCCQYCYRKSGQQYKHPERDCLRKARETDPAKSSASAPQAGTSKNYIQPSWLSTLSPSLNILPALLCCALLRSARILLYL